jgi:hypothetical protein
MSGSDYFMDSSFIRIWLMAGARRIFPLVSTDADPWDRRGRRTKTDVGLVAKNKFVVLIFINWFSFVNPLRLCNVI